MAADDELRKMERYLSGIFSQAENDLIQKSLKYMADFQRKEKVKLKKVENGEITDDEYKEWRKNQLLYGEHWTRLIQLVQTEMANCNQTALDYINDKTTQIYADSYNSIATVIKQSPVEGYSFELVDANTVKNLAKEEGIILPPKKNLDVQKDKLWNAKQVNAQLLQGILQGEDIPHIAGRMAKVCESNKSASIRNARTMVTAAENSGRQSGMNKAESDGIIFKKMWIATRDERTRETHMVLNGQLVANGEKFVTINGDEIEFPGDWRAEPSEVYNCRCTLGTIVTGFKKVKLEETIQGQQEAQVEQQTVENEQPTEETREEYELSDKVIKFIDETFANQKGFEKEDIKMLRELLENNPLEAKIFEKYGINIKWTMVKSGAQSYGKMGLDYLLNTAEGRHRFSTFFHEFGHSVDLCISGTNYHNNESEMLKRIKVFDAHWNNKITTSDEFIAAAIKDRDNVLKLIYSPDLDKETRNKLFYGSPAIQDFVSGIAGNDEKIRKKLDWAHSEKYYNRFYNIAYSRYSVADLKEKFKEAGIEVKNAKELKERMRIYDVASEAWANINEEFGTGDGDYMKTFCPNMYNLFMKVLEDNLNE